MHIREGQAIMGMVCENCGRTVSAKEGEYVYYHDRMIFACQACANRINDEVKCARKVCAALDKKKTQAEQIVNNQDAFEHFLSDIDAETKKIPRVGDFLSDISLFVSIAKSYFAKEYTEVPYNTIVAVVASLLYVLSSFDMIPDMIPGTGYEDDAMVVMFCKKFVHDDLEAYCNAQNADGKQSLTLPDNL